MEEEVKKEISCGAIVYRYLGTDLYILMIQMNVGHWSFPKGHVEGNESELETAVREVKEETNIDIIIDRNFREMTTYSPLSGVLKDVVYFVASPISNHLVAQEEEVSDVKWVHSDDALNIVTYESDRNILYQAIQYIKEKIK